MERRKDERRLARERHDALARASRATGASIDQLVQLTQRLGDIDQQGWSASIVAEGSVEADRLSSSLPALDLEIGGTAGQRAGAIENIERGLAHPLDPAHDKKWYVQWKFWSLLLGDTGAAHALTLQGLALRPTQPGDPHADLSAKARKILESWRRTSEPFFWTAVEDYVRQQAFSLETQAYLMHCIASVFGGDTMKLSDSEGERLTDLLARTCQEALGTFGVVPSSDLYRRLAEGLLATDRETGLERMLGRSDAAQFAMTALFGILYESR